MSVARFFIRVLVSWSLLALALLASLDVLLAAMLDGFFVHVPEVWAKWCQEIRRLWTS